MTQPSDELTTAIADAKRKVADRRKAVESARQDPTLRGLRKALRRLQRQRRADLARETRLKAKMTKKPAEVDAAKAG
jgi:hypothetical protein